MTFDFSGFSARGVRVCLGPALGPTLALALGPVLLLGGCGGDGGSDPAAATDAVQNSVENSPQDSPQESGPADDGAPTSLINSFSFSADPAGVSPVPSAAEVTMTGGCRTGSRLSIGFTHGDMRANDYFYIGFDSEGPVDNGQTGEVVLSEIRWDDGLVVPDGLPEGSAMRLPNRYTGPGTLTITRMEGAGLNGRMMGEVSGTLTEGRSGDTAQVSAAFDINLACGRQDGG